MERILEPELMEQQEQAEAYANADFSQAHDLFVAQFKEKFSDIPSGFNDVVLDLGCGPCDVTRRFAKAYPDTGFHAVDGSAEMLSLAQKLNQQENLNTRIKLIEGYIPGVELPQSSYHAIISNSLLHHLHNPLALWQTIQQHAKPFARVFVMDLIRPIDEQTVKFLVSEYVANEAEILQQDFEHSLRAAFTVNEVRSQLNEAGLSQLAVEEVSDRHMIIYGEM